MYNLINEKEYQNIKKNMNKENDFLQKKKVKF